MSESPTQVCGRGRRLEGDGDVALSHLFTFISGFLSLETKTTMMMIRVLPLAAAMLATAAGIAEER